MTGQEAHDALSVKYFEREVRQGRQARAAV